jgi:hypothetical protein
MKKLLILLWIVATLNAHAVVTEFAPGTNSYILTDYDSFDAGPAGNGFWCLIQAAIACVNPTNEYRFRYDSRSGIDIYGLSTNNSVILAPILGVANGTNEAFIWHGASGNGGHNSDATYRTTNTQNLLAFPGTNWTKALAQTNYWPYGTNNIHHRQFGDPCYLGTTNQNFVDSGNPAFYSNVSSNVANAWGVPYFDSTFHTVYECYVYDHSGFNVASNLFYPFNQPPDFIQASHPGKWDLQGIRYLADYLDMCQQLGGPTNIWAIHADFAAGSISLTNCAGVGTPVKTTSTLSFPVRLQRLGPPIETADGFHTNDIRAALVDVPALSNACNETLVCSNMPKGIWITYVGTVPTFTNTLLSTGSITNNYFHNYNGPWYWQKMAVLNSTRKVRDINTNDACSIAGQTYMRNFSSVAGSQWPINTGIVDYTAAMAASEQAMWPVDLEGFNAAQPQTVQVTFSNTIPLGVMSAITFKSGAAHIGQ